MTEKELQNLGFSKETIIEFEGETNPDYYYVLDIVDGITLITSSNDQIKNNDWNVEFFNTEPVIRFHKMEEVQSLINKLTKAIVTNEK